MSDITPEVKETEVLPPQQDVEKLLEKLAEYEKTSQEDKQKIKQLEDSLAKKDQELSETKQRLELLLKDGSEVQKLIEQHQKEAQEVEVLKAKSEDTLTRAKEIIFDRTKIIKNQELQIEALNTQVDSLKEVVSITKDLLEIRNLEVKQLEGKIKCMEDRVAAERERQDLMHKKLENMIRYNGDLKREYEAQLCLFKALKERYHERELAKGVVAEIRGENPPASANPANVVNDNPVNGCVENSETAVNTTEAIDNKTEASTSQETNKKTE